MAKLDSLIVDLQLNSAALRSGLNEAKDALKTFGERVAHVDEQLHALTEAKSFEIGKEVIKGLTEFVQKGAEAAEKMGLLAQASGVSVEALSKLDYAASLSGVSTEELGTAFKHLNTSLAKAGGGSKEQIALFEALGVKVKDASGHVRNSADVLTSLAEKFAGMQDGASKSALAVEVFGKAGQRMIPFLNEGAEGLAKLGDEADRFGITITSGAAASAREFEDNLKKLERAQQAVGIRVAAELAPAFSALTQQLLSSKEGADGLKGASELLANVLRVLASGAVIVGSVFDAVGTAVGAAASAIVSAAHGDFDQVLALNKTFTATLLASGSAAADQLKSIWTKADTAAEEALKKHDAAVKKSADLMQASFEAGKKARAEYETALKSLTATAEQHEAKLAGFGKGPLGLLEAELDKGKLSNELKKIGAEADAMKNRILGAAKALQELEMDRAKLMTDFNVSRSIASNAQTTKQKELDFGSIGKTPNEQRILAQAGFASFDAALKAQAAAIDNAARQTGEAELRRKENNDIGAEAMLRLADQSKLAADQAGRAADAFKASAESLVNSVHAAVSNVVGKMGQVGQVINAGIEGFKNGGAYGALIAVVAEIATMLTGFSRIVSSMNAFFGRWLKQVDGALKPFFDMIIQLAEGIGSLIEMITNATGAFEVIYAVMFALGKVVDLIELSFLYIAKGVADAFGGDKKINDMVTKISGDLQKGYHEITPPQALLDGRDLAADGLDKVGTAAQKTADKFNEMLTNLPSGYKLGKAVFGASNGEGGGGALAGSQSIASDFLQGISDGIAASGEAWTGLMGNPLQGWDGTFGNDMFTQGPGQTANSSNSSGVSDLSPDEAATWVTIWSNGVANGLTGAEAAAAADAYILSQRTRGSSSGAATAGGTGGGAGSTGIHSVADGGGGGSLVVHGDLIVHARDFQSFVKQVTEQQSTQEGNRRRNPHKAKR